MSPGSKVLQITHLLFFDPNQHFLSTLEIRIAILLRQKALIHDNVSILVIWRNTIHNDI